jgi:hypothetical protein
MHDGSDDDVLNIFYIAGIGSDPSGRGSAFCFIEGRTRLNYEKELDGLSANAAKYHALFNVVRYLSPGSEAYVLTDSMILFQDFNGHRIVQDPTLRDIAQLTYQLMYQKKVSIHVERIRRTRNPAWKLLAKSRGLIQGKT